MGRANRLATARALRHLVRAHRFVGPTLTMPQTLRAQAPAALGRPRITLLCVPVADDPTTAAARRQARRAGGVSIRAADCFVGGAVLEPARWAHTHVLVTHRPRVYPALGDAVFAAEVLVANRAALRAGVARAVLLAADHEQRRRAAAVRARNRPISTQRSLCCEARLPPSIGFEPPFTALDHHARFDELQRMHDRPHLAAPDLLRSASLDCSARIALK